MTEEEFRRRGHALVDWIADYHATIERRPVLAQVQPGEVRAGLPEHPPQCGESFEAMLADVDRVILPGLTHWQSPNFFAYFPSNSSGPAILGELLSAGLGVQGMLWATSPACTELETLMLDWLAEILDLPKFFHSSQNGGGVIQDTASSAALCALIAAREAATGGETNESGVSGPRLTAYASSQAHSSIEKAVKIAGLGRRQLRLIEVDAEFAMKPEALAVRMAADREAGYKPFFVAATVGTTSSNAMDPLAAIGGVCQEQGAWLHVDAAMSGTAALCPEYRHYLAGLELAESFNFNPHKWMFTNFDCSCFWVKERAALTGALGILPEYLKNRASAGGKVIDYRDWQIPLGRRFRALKLWFVIRHYGVEGLQREIRRHVALAQEFAGWVEADGDFELAAPAPLNLVCFRHRGGDAVNQHLMDRVNQSGEMYLTHTRLEGKLTLRMCIGQAQTEARHVQRAWRQLQTEARKLAVELAG